MGRMASREVCEISMDFRRQNADVAINERRRAKGYSTGELESSTDRLHRVFFGDDAPSEVGRHVLVIRPFNVNIGSDELDCLDCGGVRVDGNEIDAFQGRDELSTQLLGKRRAMAALVHISVGRESHHEHVTHRLRLFEIAEVADVEKVEDAVAVDDALALGPE